MFIFLPFFSVSFSSSHFSQIINLMYPDTESVLGSRRRRRQRAMFVCVFPMLRSLIKAWLTPDPVCAAELSRLLCKEEELAGLLERWDIRYFHTFLPPIAQSRMFRKKQLVKRKKRKNGILFLSVRRSLTSDWLWEVRYQILQLVLWENKVS